MTVKELFSKEFLFESTKKEKRTYKIFYKLDILLKKKKEEAPAPIETAPAPTETAPAPQEATPEVAAPAPQEVASQAAPEAPAPAEVAVPTTPEVALATQNNSQGKSFFSVVTEDDDTKEISDDNVIVRKLSGEISLQQEDINNIQSIDDIYQKLQEEKDNGANILDELSLELLQNLTQTNQLQQDLKNKIDIKESNIFAEIIYGKKIEESVGIRLIKRKNSDLVTNSMLIDNQIVNSRFSKERLDSKIVDMRNEEYSNDK